MLLSELRGEDPKRRQLAALLLGRLKVVRALEPLTALLADPDSAMRWAAVSALTELDEPSVPSRLLARFEMPEVRFQASGYLGRKGAAMVPLFLEALNRVKGGAARRDLTGLLARSADPSAVGHLRRLIRDDEPWVRHEAARQLGRLKAAEAIEELRSTLGDLWARRQGKGCDPFGKPATPSPTGSIVVRFRSGSMPRSGAAAAEALAALGEPGWEALVQALGEKDWPVRWDAIHGLSITGDPRAEGPLAKVFEESDHRLRSPALRAIAFVLRDRSMPYLRRGLKDSSVYVRQMAVQMLGGRKRLPEARNLLLGILKLDDAALSPGAITALGSLEDLRLARHLEPLRNHLQRSVREAAEAALARLERQRRYEEFRRTKGGTSLTSGIVRKIEGGS